MAKEVPIWILLIRVAAFVATLTYLLFWNFAVIAVMYSSTTIKTAAFLVVEVLTIFVVVLSYGRPLSAIALYLGLMITYILVLYDFNVEFWASEPTHDFWGFIYLLSFYGVGVLLIAANPGIVRMTEPRLVGHGQPHVELGQTHE